jgi:hypothetical protein
MGSGTSQCTRDTWTPVFGLETSGAWVLASDSKGMVWSARPMINGSSIRIQFYWVLHQDSMFMDDRILNIIIIIIIIIKLINKFERKYYYLYYKFYGIFYKNKE